MIQVVLDANVLVSGLISREGPPGQILDAWLVGRFQLWVSSQIMGELKRVLLYPRILDRLAAGQVTMLLEKLNTTAKFIDATLKLDVLTHDPSDNIYLACAVEAKADYLITGNIDHFEEAGGDFRGVKIISPRIFLEIFGAE